MNQQSLFEQVVILGGYGENSTLSLELVKIFIEENIAVVLITKPGTLIQPHDKVLPFYGDMNDQDFIASVFSSVFQKTKTISAYIHIAGSLLRKPFLLTTPVDYQRIMERNFLCVIRISQTIIEHAISQSYSQHLVYLGATASLRGGKEFSAFSAAKFALRGFVQSIAREFSSQGIHACHLVVDGIIDGNRADTFFKKTESECIRGKDLAKLIFQLIQQPSSTWTQELDVRPSGEKF